MEDRDQKKQIPLRITQTLWNDLMAWANDDFRSVNGQIEYLLTECVKRRKQGAREYSAGQAKEKEADDSEARA